MQQDRQLLILLSPGRSFSTVISAMLGRHPQITALPETFLFARDTIAEYLAETGSTIRDVGLLDVVGRLMFANQANSRAHARRWLVQHQEQTTTGMFDRLLQHVDTTWTVEKTPVNTSRIEYMQRIEGHYARRAFYIHLVRHPHTFGVSLLETARFMMERVPPDIAERFFHDGESIFSGLRSHPGAPLDPEVPWYRRHSLIKSFLSLIPRDRQFRMRGEDMMQKPFDCIQKIASWLDLAFSEDIVDRMLETDLWEYSQSPHATFGGDRKFYTNPRFRLPDSVEAKLIDYLPWSSSRTTLRSETIELAQSLGY